MSERDPIEEAERLFELATPEEWLLEPPSRHTPADKSGPYIGCITLGKDDRLHEIIIARVDDRNNKAAIVALHNAAPALFAKAREVKRLREALEITRLYLNAQGQRDVDAALSTKAK